MIRRPSKKMLDEHSLSFRIDDWIEPDHCVWGFLDKSLLRLNKCAATTALTFNLSLAIRKKFAWSRIQHGVNLLSNGQQFITDRLHGQIIATSLEIPEFVFDSFDEKVSSFHQT